ncbi:hypothetical protein B7463_g10598, partial [Scytalidium lignicola]
MDPRSPAQPEQPPDPPRRFNDLDREELMQMINDIMDARERRGQNGDEDNRDDRRDNTRREDSEAPEGRNRPLKTDDVGYFNPEAEQDDIALSSSKLIYSDVYIFTDRLQHLADLHGEAKVQEVFPTTLRGSAALWYTAELSSLERQLLATTPIVSIIRTLINRFKEQPALALKALADQRYTFAEIRAGKSIRLYVQSMFKHSKAAGMATVYNQLLAVWNGLDIAMRLHVTMPRPDTSMSDFLRELDSKMPIFKEMAYR